MPKVSIERPDTSLSELMAQASALGIEFEIPRSNEEWPTWSPDHPYRKHSCDKKGAYLYAEGALAEAIRVFRLKRLRVRVYPCPLGVHYHLTKREQWTDASAQTNGTAAE